MSIKTRYLKTKALRERDGSYAIACSALGVYTVGDSLDDAKRNFEEALELHLSALKEKAFLVHPRRHAFDFLCASGLEKKRCLMRL